MRKQRQRIILGCAAALVGVPLAAVLAASAVWPRAAYAVFRNLTAQTVPLNADQPWAGGETYRNIQYAEISPSDYLDLYVPRSEERPPLLVLIHGGGFVFGDSQNRQSQLMYSFFRDHGFACASVNYRLAQEAPFPGAVEDCKAAIRFLRAHADEYGYDAGRIAVWGESAGGYLAVMCAVTGDHEFNALPFIGQDWLGDVSAKVDVLVDYYGAVKKDMEKDLAAIGVPKFIYQIANSWISGDVLHGYENVESFWLRKNVSEMTAEELAYSDPYAYINNNLSADSDLSAWLVHGDCDLTVPYPQSDRLCRMLSEFLGTDRVVYRLIPGMGHAADGLYADKELEQLEVFLNDHLL